MSSKRKHTSACAILPCVIVFLTGIVQGMVRHGNGTDMGHVEPGNDTYAKLTRVDEPFGIRDSYIVCLKESANKKRVERHLRRAKKLCECGEVITITYPKGRRRKLKEARFYIANCTLARNLTELRRKTRIIDYMVQNEKVEVATECDFNRSIQNYDGYWGMDKLDENIPGRDLSMKSPGNGSGVDVYILDTGIRKGHPEFSGRASEGENFVGEPAGTARDGHSLSHGTHVAGIVAGQNTGVSPQANVIGVKVLTDAGSGTWFGVMRALEWVRNSGGKNNAMNDAVRAIVKAGVTVIAAAGNADADACRYSPGSSPDAITVGSTDRNDKRSSFSNKGGCLDIFAPGSGIRSSVSNSGYSVYSGTSMAAPHAAGLAAAFLSSQPDLTDEIQIPREVKNYLIDDNNLGKNKVQDAGTVTRYYYDRFRRRYVRTVSESPNLLLHTGCT